MTWTRTLLLGILVCGCAASRSENIALDIEPEKRDDDLRVASLVKSVAWFDKVVLPSSDGLPIPAYLFKPLDSSDEPRPAVIFLHGGEHGTFSSRSVRRVLPLVDKGWVIIAPDYRGSSGYGREFHDAADYGGREIDDVLAVRDWLLEYGHAIEGKVAVLGTSHGGYNALMASARLPDGFAACVDFYGPTDLVYRVTATSEENRNASPGDPEKFARMVGATIEDNEQAYRDRSPRFLAEHIRAPVLIVHGTQDGLVGIRESEWLVETLRETGHTDLEFLRVEGGRHGYPEELYRAAWDRALSFIESAFDC